MTIPHLPPEIFKAYDIRGIVGRTLTPEIVRTVGRALGTLAAERGRDTLVIGRDGRLSGPALSAALADGIRATGAHVVDVGMVTTPMSYFAAQHRYTYTVHRSASARIFSRKRVSPNKSRSIDRPIPSSSKPISA